MDSVLDEICLGRAPFTSAVIRRAARGETVPTRPIVLIHGYRGTAREWESVMKTLPADRDVWAVDLCIDPNAGQDIASLHALLDQVHQLSRADEIDLVGISMGGFLAAHWAAARPGIVHRLVLLAPALVPLQAVWQTPGVRRLISRHFVQRIDDRRWEQSLAQGDPDRFFAAETPNHEAIPQAVRQQVFTLYVRALTSEPQPGYAAARLAQLRELLLLLRQPGAISRMLASIDAEILWLHGEADRVVPFDRSRRLALARRNLRFSPIPTCGHLLHFECPDLVARALRGEGA